MSTFIGVNIESAHVLTRSLRSWDAELDDARALVREAEMLADIPTGVQSVLSAIGADGRAIAAAVGQAATRIESFRIDLTAFSPRLTGPAARRTGSPHYGDKRSISAMFQEAGKRLHQPGVTKESLMVRPWHVEGARDEIEQAFIAGRDTSPAIDHYRNLLGEFVGDTSVQAGVVAMALLSQGVPLGEMETKFTSGSDAFLGQLAALMAAGTAPAEAELHPAFFPEEYVAWHDYEAASIRFGLAAWALERGSFGDDSRIVHPYAHDHLTAVANELPDHWGERAWLHAMLDGDDVAPAQIERVKELVGAFVQSQLDALGPRPVLHVETLHDLAPIDDLGRITAFQAIGAAASRVSSPPASYVGDSYAQFHYAFDAAELGDAFDYLVKHDHAAAAFFTSLGPDGAADLLPYFRVEGDPLDEGELLRAISIAFGHASHHLSSDFGADAVRSGQDRHRGFLASRLVAEHLFAHGAFDPEFLTEAAAASVTGPDPIFDPIYGVDPRMLILTTLARQQLGAEFVRALVDEGSLGDFLWPQTPFNAIGVGPDRTLSDVPATNQILVQAGGDAGASAAVIVMAGARLRRLDLDIANGVSSVIAQNLARYELSTFDAFPDPNLLVAAQNLFAAGAGIDIEIAAHGLTVGEIKQGLATGSDEWWHDMVWPAMVGHLEASQYLAYESNAYDHDEAIRNTNEWLSRASFGGGVAFGAVGLVTGGVGWGLGGLVMTGVGSPFFQRGGATRVHQVDRAALQEANANPALDQDLVFLVALESGAVDMPPGAAVEVIGVGSHDLSIQVTSATGESTSFVVGKKGWRDSVVGALDLAGATITSVGDSEGSEVGEIVRSIAAVGITTPRRSAFDTTTDIKDKEEDDD